jgi:16S rRNA (guanine527-N7)-methyltransferase
VARSASKSPPPLAALLQSGTKQLRLPASDETRDLLLIYVGELAKWNRAYNLTAIRDTQDMIVRHVLDSLSILPLMRGRVLDVGSGAGLPAVPIAIAAPALHVTALDSTGKKARFLRHIQRTLRLPNLEVAETRVEAFSPPEKFDVVISRAFASLADFFKLTEHLLAPGGQWVAMKGKLDAAELAGVPAGGIEIRESRRLHVPGLAEERHAVIAVRQ